MRVFERSACDCGGATIFSKITIEKSLLGLGSCRSVPKERGEMGKKGKSRAAIRGILLKEFQWIVSPVERKGMGGAIHRP